MKHTHTNTHSMLFVFLYSAFRSHINLKFAFLNITLISSPNRRFIVYIWDSLNGGKRHRKLSELLTLHAAF